MTVLIFVLFLTSITFLVLGLIKPKLAWANSRKRVAVILVPVTLLLFVGIGISASSDNDDASTGETERPSKEWYQGGTLHKSTVSVWQASDDANRLATAADWTTALLGDNQAHQLGLDGIKVKAADMVVCINESTADNEALQSQTVSGFAAICALAMGWKTSAAN
ncbi:hypothetical protein ABIE64_002213 [Thalassospira sp. MBR-102]|uniref:hypothetical protein n=1 Tax=Thalassospira sp. MBR-102 TaxID=3156466 RepID=UPI00339A14A3